MNTEKLIILKSFYLASRIVSDANRSTAIEFSHKIVSYAEKQCSPLQRVFYLLFRCEVCREDFSSLVHARLEAQNFCSQSIWDDYMKMVAKTQSRTQVVGGGSFGGIARGKTNQHIYNTVIGPYGEVQSERIDLAFEALGSHVSHLNKSESRFIFQVSLKEMLKKHFGHSDFFN